MAVGTSDRLSEAGRPPALSVIFCTQNSKTQRKKRALSSLTHTCVISRAATSSRFHTNTHPVFPQQCCPMLTLQLQFHSAQCTHLIKVQSLTYNPEVVWHFSNKIQSENSYVAQRAITMLPIISSIFWHVEVPFQPKC